MLCPRKCGADRENGQKGRCHADDKIRVARAALHFWEEPCISGSDCAVHAENALHSASVDAKRLRSAPASAKCLLSAPVGAKRISTGYSAPRLNGSGAVFFSGCPLGCVFCQNRAISHGGIGTEITIERLAEIFLELEEQGALNINLVTAGHYAPQVCTALRMAKKRGLDLPVVWNSSGYETVETLQMLDGLVDIYLPDLKYLDPTLARLYSHAENYPEVAMAAIREMVRQQPQPRFEEDDAAAENAAKTMDNPGTADDAKTTDNVKNMEETEDGECRMTAGVMVRHLLLPGHVREAKRVVLWLHETFGDRIYISLMNQYMPPGQIAEHENSGVNPRNMGAKEAPAENMAVKDAAGNETAVKNTYEKIARPDPVFTRPVTKREYEWLLDYALQIGVTQGFYQEGGTAARSFIPAFDGTGVTKPGGGV